MVATDQMNPSTSKGVQFQKSATPPKVHFARCQLSKCERLRTRDRSVVLLTDQMNGISRLHPHRLDNCKWLAGDVMFLFIKIRNRAADDDVPRIYEPRSERMRRRFSLIVINILGFISCLGFSIVLTSAFPYLVKVSCHYPLTNSAI